MRLKRTIFMSFLVGFVNPVLITGFQLFFCVYGYVQEGVFCTKLNGCTINFRIIENINAKLSRG